MQSLNAILEAYFDFKDNKSLSKLKRGILLNISTTRNPAAMCQSNFWIPWCQAELQMAEQQQFCYRIMHTGMQRISATLLTRHETKHSEQDSV